jgi:hypothetical protein
MKLRSTSGLGLRQTMSGALAALLLCVLSLASVCDLSCQLPALAGLGCCVDKAAAVAVVKTQSSECHDMAGMPTTASSSVDASLHALSQTGMVPCERDVADVTAVTSIDRNDHSLDRTGLVAAIANVSVTSLHQPVMTLRGVTPPLGASGFRPLLVSLRV